MVFVMSTECTTMVVNLRSRDVSAREKRIERETVAGKLLEQES